MPILRVQQNLAGLQEGLQPFGIGKVYKKIWDSIWWAACKRSPFSSADAATSRLSTLRAEQGLQAKGHQFRETQLTLHSTAHSWQAGFAFHRHTGNFLFIWLLARPLSIQPCPAHLFTIHSRWTWQAQLSLKGHKERGAHGKLNWEFISGKRFARKWVIHIQLL